MDDASAGSVSQGGGTLALVTTGPDVVAGPVVAGGRLVGRVIESIESIISFKIGEKQMGGKKTLTRKLQN